MPPDERSDRRVEEARGVLRGLNFDADRYGEIPALVLLALLGLTPDVPWSAPTNPTLRTAEILAWLRRHYGRNFGPSTRETIREVALRQFDDAALVVPNPDEPNRPSNSPRFCYQIEPSALELLRHRDEDDFPARVAGYLADRPRLVNHYAKARKADPARPERRLQLRQEWVLGELIGGGGFGEVYAAQSADREGVAKLVPKAPGAEREVLFEDLAEVPNVVPIIDSGETKDAWVLIMPRAETSLRQHQVNVGGPLEVTEAVGILTDIACALVGLDGRVVHRDLKPENVLLLDGHWCLADFGISRYAEATTAPDTRKYALSPPYAAPERWRLERATIATDVYSVGVIAYELLSGSLPFGGPADYDFREQHLHGTPKPLDYLPAGLGALIDECLYKAPEARPSPSNLLARLARVAEPPSSAGLAELQEAHRAEVARRREAERWQSEAQTEAARRRALLDAATAGLARIADALKEAILEAAPATTQHTGRGGGWSLGLNRAQLRFAPLTATSPTPWGSWKPPAFDVIAHASLSLVIPPDRFQYEGRSHSLWYCDAQEAGRYRWFETAFMFSPLLARQGRQEPFALDPGEESAKAVWQGIAEYQVAWPFTAVGMDELGEFISRWASWFAAAARGQLQHPSSMPERPAQGGWRRS